MFDRAKTHPIQSCSWTSRTPHPSLFPAYYALSRRGRRRGRSGRHARERRLKDERWKGEEEELYNNNNTRDYQYTRICEIEKYLHLWSAQ